MDKYDSLKLENQFCFPLYVASKEVIRKYKPLLDELDLTYTQYIAMMVLWEEKKCKVTELGKKLYLDTGTISPLIRKLKSKNYIKISRAEDDERVQVLEITQEGEALRDRALKVPQEMLKSNCLSLSLEETLELRRLLKKVMGN